MYRYAAMTRKGVGRQHNEDRIMVAGNFLAEGELQGVADGSLLTVVCDGVGGQAYGEEAAALVAKAYLRLAKERLSHFDITASVFMVNEELCKAQRRRDGREEMASTLAGVSIDGSGDITAFHVGDTRIYSLEKNALRVLSTDHGRANVLSQYMGMTPLGLHPGVTRSRGPAALLLCSDGVYGHLSQGFIASVLSGGASQTEKLRVLLDTAVQQGSEDDMSAVLLSPL